MSELAIIPGRYYKHLKTGGIYFLQREGRIEKDSSKVVIYSKAGDMNETWVRPRDEFLDGRFVLLDQGVEW